MKYSATLKVHGDAALIQKIFAAEDSSIREKASYRLKKNQEGITFSVEAEDSVALRTALNSITKIMTVIEKMKKI